MKLRKLKVTVVYKGGAVVRFRCHSFTATKTSSKLNSVEWDSPKPEPLLFGVDDVSAIYVKARWLP